jgi:hypothetical protein
LQAILLTWKFLSMNNADAASRMTGNELLLFK